MRITVIGTGYVGLVVGACLAETGHQVTGADVDRDKIDGLAAGRVPIHEPGLDLIVRRNLAKGRLVFTTDVGAAVHGSDVVFITVGTPADAGGFADLRQVLGVASTIGGHLDAGTVVVTKSTVPVGTALRVRKEIAKRSRVRFHVCSNPEFLKEGDAVADFMRPDRIVCGIESDEVRPVLEELYEPFVRNGNPLIFVDIASAELAKYAANAMLAARISFMNQIAALCEATGADVSEVRRVVGSDPRIGRAFLFAGAGYGGSCFPKDIRALIAVGDALGIDLPLLRAVHEVNERQKTVLATKILSRFGDDLSGLRIAVWGLAFKAGTDDVRESASLVVIDALLARGAEVVVHDPVAVDQARRLHLADTVTYAEDEYAACDGADALVVVTEWQQYRRPDWEAVRMRLKQSIVFDGRNLFSPDAMRRTGFEHHSIGRESVGAASVALRVAHS